jgi:hypothetical protein
MWREGNKPGQLATEVIDADGDAAIVGELGTGPRAILFIVDLAIMFAIGRGRHVVLGQLLVVEADLC